MIVNKAALITGGAARIGKEIAISFAEMGFDIALHCFESENKAQSTQQEILEKNVKCSVFQADFSTPGEIFSLMKNISKEYDVHFLVNNASVFVESSLLDTQYDMFEDIFNINFKAPYILTKEFAKLTNTGLIINILDTKISQNATDCFDYLLTKKFLEDFTKMSALHLSPGIRVNAIAPGIILPPKDKDAQYLQGLATSIPLKKIGSVDCIKNTVRYFVTNDFITGQIIYVDGGENLV
ncbi:MAG: SDR family oxidoreductase [Candidatus Electrothrix sp. AR3]|nr:SDR family oxidoreductase [Candidatus Electrothrix sp. AR3]